MSQTRRAKTMTTTVDAAPEDVMEYLGNPQNLPRWNRGFCRSVRKQGARWMMDTGDGFQPVRVLRDDRAGVVDVVSGPAGREETLPLRIVPNGAGAEVVLILVQGADASESDFHRQLNRAQQGLRDLKNAFGKAGTRTEAPADAEGEAAWSPVESTVPEAAQEEGAEGQADEAAAAPAEAPAPEPSIPGCGVKLFVGNLPFQWTETELRAHFAAIGAVASVEIARFGRRGRSRGFGFVEMVTETDSQTAIEKLNGSTAGTRPITVRTSKPKPSRQERQGADAQPGECSVSDESASDENVAEEAGAEGSEAAPSKAANPFGFEEPEDGQLQQPALNPSARPRGGSKRQGRGARGGASGGGHRGGGRDFNRGPREFKGSVAAPRRRDAKMITTGEYEFFPRGQAVERSTEPEPPARPSLTRHGHSVEESAYFEDTGDVENRGSRPRSGGTGRRRPAPRRRRS